MKTMWIASIRNRKFKQNAFLLIFVALSFNPLAAQGGESISEKIDRLFSEYSKPTSPGCAVGVFKDGKLVIKKAYGLANLEYGIPMKPSTPINIGSISKQFTAMAVVMLAEQGKISLDDDYRKYFPEMKDYGNTITIRHLLNHTSGLRSYTSLLAIAGWTDLEDVTTLDQVLQLIERQEQLDFPPGEGYRYSNTGYLLLAEMVARVTGKSFREWAKENLLDPLGMIDTIVLDDYRRIMPGRAYSYSTGTEHGYLKEIQASSCTGAGNIYTTIEDLGKWEGHLDHLHKTDSPILELMLQPGELNDGTVLEYAAGFYLDTYGDRKMIRHGGGSAGFVAELTWVPDLEFSVSVLCNLSSIKPQKLSLEITDLYFPKLAGNPGMDETKSRVPEKKIDREIFERYTGIYQHKSGFKIRISLEDENLVAHVPGWGASEILPETETEFASANEEGVKFLFRARGDSGFDLILRQPETDDIHLSKAEAPDLTAEQLLTYTGEFFSRELQTTYSLVAEDGGLVAKHPRNKKVKLTPETEDTFSGDRWWLRYVTFTRNENGEITGLKMDGFRSTNLEFTKL